MDASSGGRRGRRRHPLAASRGFANGFAERGRGAGDSRRLTLTGLSR